MQNNAFVIWIYSVLRYEMPGGLQITLKRLRKMCVEK